MVDRLRFCEDRLDIGPVLTVYCQDLAAHRGAHTSTTTGSDGRTVTLEWEAAADPAAHVWRCWYEVKRDKFCGKPRPCPDHPDWIPPGPSHAAGGDGV